jgi:hypothetical protein
MKSKIRYLLHVFLSFLVLLTACAKTEYEPGLKGNMVGYVVTFDEYSKPFAEHNKVLVMAIGEGKVFTTATDKKGRFEFDRLPTGTYELQFEKKGFSTLKQFGIQHLGGEPTILNFDLSNYTAYFLFQKISGNISIIKIENDSIYCQCSFVMPQPDQISIQLFVSQDPDFRIDETAPVLPNLWLSRRGDIYKGALFYATDFFSAPGLPYDAGETVYLKALICPNYSTSMVVYNKYVNGIMTYFDYDKNLVIYPGLSSESELFTYVTQ